MNNNKETPLATIMIDDSDEKDNNDGLLTSQKALRRLLDDTLPHQEEIVYAFGYGSGVLSQEQPDNDTKQKSSNSNNNSDNKMVDLIIVVRDSFEFHKANYQANPSHYWIPPPVRFMASSNNNKDSSSSSSTSSSSSSSIARWCTWWQRHEVPSLFQNNKQRTSWLQNPGVYYNIVENNNNDNQPQQQPSLKYGVVQVNDLIDDLKLWKFLYLAGRMHKPIVTILNRQDDIYNQDSGQANATATASFLSISQAQQYNLMAALSTSLLLLSSTSSSSAGSNCCNNIPSAMIFRHVAALSYAGDFRMSYAEDPNKIDKLVQGGGGSGPGGGQLQRFESLYHHAASQLVQSGVLSIDKSSNENNGTRRSSSSMMWSWDASSPTARQLLWSKLPLRLQQQQQQHDSSSTATTATARVNHQHQHQHQHHDNYSEWLSHQLALIVAPAARYQSFKGIVTAGPRKAWIYAARKISKRFWPK